MNAKEIKKYVNGHIELMVETLLDECEDWSGIGSTKFEKDTGGSIIGAVYEQRSLWRFSGFSEDDIERKSLKYARELAAKTVAAAIDEGRALSIRAGQNCVSIDDEHCSTVLFLGH